MSETFDPYREWLRIPTDRRPVNWYELLGLSEFESDADRLEEAYYARYTQIRKYETGPYGSQAQRLLSELGDAYRGLSNPAEKLRYDEERRRGGEPDPIVAELAEDPWQRIDALLLSYLTDPQAEQLDRIERLAMQADGRNGRTRLARAALVHGIEPQRFEPILRRQAERDNLAVCGECYALVPAPARTPNLFVKVTSDEEVGCELFLVAFRKSLLQNHVAVTSQAPELLDNQEYSCFRLTGLIQVATAAALPPSLFGVGISLYHGVPVDGLLTTLATAYVLVVLALSWFYRPRFQTALDAVWTELTPRLRERSPSPRLSALMAGLAKTSRGAGNSRHRSVPLQATIDWLLPASGNGGLPEEHVAELFRLAILDSMGGTPDFRRFRAIFSQLLDACLRRRLSLDVLDFVLREGETFKVWSPVQLGTLRLHLLRSCEQAFLAAADVMQIWSKSRTVRSLLFDSRKTSEQYVARLLELDALTARIPFPRHMTNHGMKRAFQLLAENRCEQLARWPDLLFGTDDQEFAISSQGLCFREWLFTSPPKVFVRFVRCSDRTGPPELGAVESYYQMQVGPHVVNFRKDPFELFTRFMNISSWYFERLLPEFERAERKPASPQVLDWLAIHAVACPQCGRRANFARGEILGRKT